MEDTKQKGTFATHNVVACFHDMQGARRAIEALEHAGVPGSDISLLGPLAEQASDGKDTTERDEEIIATATRATLGGAAAGAGIGGVVGFLAGAAAFGIPGVGPAVGAGVWAATLGGVAAGGGVGFTAGAMARMKQSAAWELTLQEVSDGYVVVGAHTDDPNELEKAVDALRGQDPAKMRRFDEDGNEIAA